MGPWQALHAGFSSTDLSLDEDTDRLGIFSVFEVEPILDEFFFVNPVEGLHRGCHCVFVHYREQGFLLGRLLLEQLDEFCVCHPSPFSFCVPALSREERASLGSGQAVHWDFLRLEVGVSEDAEAVIRRNVGLPAGSSISLESL